MFANGLNLHFRMFIVLFGNKWLTCILLASANIFQEEIKEEIKSVTGSISHTEQLEHSLEQRAKSSSKHTTAVVPKIKLVNMPLFNICVSFPIMIDFHCVN